ncbi:MAG: diacylglycerol kinase family lipid kinase [Planctomycetes bacterium]|nr:diacylglycerol kinase family lipid kinase [Planctomycetota bacterium]
MEPEHGYISFIINPKSGASSSKRLVNTFKDYLSSRNFAVQVTFTKSLDHARELANEAAVAYDCALVVAAGGDGTIREIVHGLEGSDKPLIIVPCGTENLLASELGFDEKAETLIKAFEGKCLHSLDVGSANGRIFTSIAGFGFDGDIVKRVHNMRSGHINHLDYFWPIWRTFWEHKFPVLKVRIDGVDIFEGHAMAFVGNISRYAIGLQILRDADFGDGLLDVCIYKCKSHLHLAKHSALTAIKHHANRSDVIYKQGKTIEISSTSGPVNTQIDGDPGPALPMKIHVIPQAVRVLVPPDAKPAGIRARLMRILG